MIRQFALAGATCFGLALLAASNGWAATAEPPPGMQYCKADIQRLCSGIQPGGGRILQCLKGHMNEVSIGCGKALQKAKGQMGKLQ